MKKYTLLLLLGSVLLFGRLQAQDYTVQSIGFYNLGGSSGGNVVSENTSGFMIGFPYPILYSTDVFDHNFTISKGYYADYVQLNWNIISNQDLIKRFRIFRKIAGDEEDSVQVASISSSEYSWKDINVEKGVIYEYSIFAEGVADALRVPYVNIVNGKGFALALGNASGRVTYSSGTAVAGVTVLAEADLSFKASSVYLNGIDAYLLIKNDTARKELNLGNGFTIEFWYKLEGFTQKGILFSKGPEYNLFYDNGALIFDVRGVEAKLDFSHPLDTFVHVTAVYDTSDGGSLSLFAQIDDLRTYYSKVDGVITSGSVNKHNMLFGSDSTDFFKGHIDEIRLWRTSKTDTNQLLRDNTRYLLGNEANIGGYWRLNESIGNEFFDVSKKGAKYYENHGALMGGAAWSTQIPLQAQLAFKGITDNQGNYFIQGFPYETAGSLYKFTPLFGTHSFNPGQQTRFIADGASIANNVDFTDKSSFTLTGFVYYDSTTFPVEGASILVDGLPVSDKTGKVVMSKSDGTFSVDVPIGEHLIGISKNQHVFKRDTVSFDFQSPVTSLLFEDITKVKVAGRVTGGPVQAAKPLGFGLSKNNLGNATISLQTEKEGVYLYTTKTGKILPGVPKIVTEKINSNLPNSSTYKIQQDRTVTITPDPVTGEYVAYLIPEKFIITSVKAGTYEYGPEYLTSLDLKSTHNDTIGIADTLIKRDLTIKPVSKDTIFKANGWPKVRLLYDELLSVTEGDRNYIVGTSSFSLDKRQDFIYRVRPEIVVAQKGKDYFGEDIYQYEDKVLNTKEPVVLYENGKYTFGHPVFRQATRYTFNISLSESYNNGSVTDVVPVNDGSIQINNNFDINNGGQIFTLDDQGKVEYTFNGGKPELNEDPTDPANNFTKTLSIAAFSGNNGAIKTVWNEGLPIFRALLLGSLPVGTSFVTTGPNQLISILRDPPGSGSSVSLSSGSTVETTSSMSLTDEAEESLTATVALGTKIVFLIGVGVASQSEVEVENNISVGFRSVQTWANSNSSTTSYTTTQAWSTSADPGFVGDDADVFIGRASTIVYGSARVLDIDKDDQGGFGIALRDGIRMSPEFTTAFMHTQGHIKSAIIPNLQSLRNSFLIYTPDTSKVVLDDMNGMEFNAKNCFAKSKFISLIPSSDERFGSDNTDEEIWGNEVATVLGNGPSYAIKTPKGCEIFVADTIFYFNAQIKSWIDLLTENEKQKATVKAGENFAFNSGASYTSSLTSSSSYTKTSSFAFVINPTAGALMGFAVNKTGIQTELALSYSYTNSKETSTTTSNEITYEYTLDDGDGSDYYSINIGKPADGFGPVFRINGGVTSCPYQGQIETEFYKEGGNSVVLSPATVAVDAPLLTVNNPVIKDVVSNRAAIFELILQNNSGSKEDRWYTLKIEDETNPNGAIIEIDGAPIANGRDFLVKYGISLSKSLSLRKGKDDVMAYEKIRLIFGSQCESETIFDTVSISAYFIPGCSDVVLKAPVNNWVLNTNAPLKDTLSLIINGYSQSFENFTKIALQYKPAGSSQWVTDMYFYNMENVSEDDFANANDPKKQIEGAAINYAFDMHSLPDRDYNLRAVAVCDLGAGQFVETPTDIHSGTKDVKRPQLFGTPQPADGILSPNDDISVQFDEEIEQGIISFPNFTVNAVLNGYKLNHNTSLQFDGIKDYARTGDGLSLASKSFTVEFWAKRNRSTTEEVIFSKYVQANDKIEIGFTAENRFYIDLGTDHIVTSLADFGDLDWHHYAITFDNSASKLSAYKDDKRILEGITVKSSFTGDGPVTIGKSSNNDKFFQGYFNELRIWKKALQLGDIYSKMSVSIPGNSIGLAGYWPFDEGFGKFGVDKAKARNAALFCNWIVLPKGRSLSFNGNSYASIKTASKAAISQETDFTIEFWYKAGSDQAGKTLFSSGRGDGTDKYNVGSWRIGFSSDGQIEVINNGISLVTNNSGLNFLDNSWHHFAISVTRLGNTNLFFDGNLLKSQASAPFGPLTGLNMYIGARGYKASPFQIDFDQYFTGHIDEFRIWNLAKKQQQILLGYNAKLKGTEKGLAVYYPFESYTTLLGVVVMTETLIDNAKPLFILESDTAKLISGAGFSSEVPNIKDVRPLQDVKFSWATNVDKIIITLDPSMAANVEQTVVEITVDGIEDKFQNRLSSPVTWTAFVNKNQIYWEKDVLNLAKKPNEDFSFQTSIVNAGGKQQSYTISNLPNWLTVSPSNGEIDPLSATILTFTVNPGLNSGYYQEEILLTSDFGYSEELTLNLQNFKQMPDDWKIDSSDFQYSMNIVGQIRIGNVISNDPFDKIAVFVGEECRGIGKMQYVPEFDNYQVYLSAYSNKSQDEQLSFKIWDNSEGLVYVDVTPVYVFEPNRIIGEPASPIIFDANTKVENEIKLPKGWRWISFNLTTPDLKNVNTILKNLSNQSAQDVVKGELFYDQYNTAAKLWQGTLTSNGGFENKKMYKIKSTSAGKIVYTGEVPEPEKNPLTLKANWNWVGFVGRQNLTTNEALAGFKAKSGDVIKSQYQLAVYDDNNGWLGNLKFLMPNEGYMMNVQNAGQFSFPNISSLSHARTDEVAVDTVSIPGYDRNAYSQQMNVIAEVVNYDSRKNPDNMLLAYQDGKVCGVVRPEFNPVTKNYTYYLTTGSNNSTHLSFALADAKGNKIGDIAEPLVFSDNKLVGTPGNPVSLHLITDGEGVVNVYPNPFSNTANISVKLDSPGIVEINILDMFGREVGIPYSQNYNAGTFNIDLYSKFLEKPSKGMYTVRVTLNDKIHYYPVIAQ